MGVRIINIFILMQQINLTLTCLRNLILGFLCLEYVTIHPVKHYLVLGTQLSILSSVKFPPVAWGRSFLSLTTALSVYRHPHYHAILYF